MCLRISWRYIIRIYFLCSTLADASLLLLTHQLSHSVDIVDQAENKKQQEDSTTTMINVAKQQDRAELGVD